MQKKWIPIVLFSFLMIQVANAQSNDEKKWLRKNTTRCLLIKKLRS
jgi:hypothetical protein